jgi:hypothetical protein
MAMAVDGNLGYRGLDVWQKSMALAEIVYQLTSNLPDSERYV